MKRRWTIPGLPLLGKELIEQSSRRRTYVIRCAYALLLFTAVLIAFYSILSDLPPDPLLVIGSGGRLFDWLLTVQFIGVHLFMPAIMCSVITAEKERGSLELLFLTRLGPGTILLEKYSGRITAMLTFLLLALPPAAFAYSLGGISQLSLWGGFWFLLLIAFQLGALALCCSAWCRSTVGAFVASYVLGAALLLGPAVLEEMGAIDLVANSDPAFFTAFGVVYEDKSSDHLTATVLEETGLIGGGHEDVLYLFWAPKVFDSAVNDNADLQSVLLRSTPIIVSTFCFLLLARLFVVSRAAVRPRDYLVQCFRILDGMFTALNERFARGVVLTREVTSLPADEPVAWRETTRKSLGTFRYLLRLFLAAQIPVIVVCVISAATHYEEHILASVSMTLFALWILAVLIVSVKSAGLICGERTRSSLDVLLATPLSTRDILRQKMKGVRRLCLVLSVPFLTIFLFEAFWRGDAYARYGFSTTAYLTISILSLVIYLSLVSQLSLMIGMRVRSQGRAVIAALAAIVGWCTLPLALLFAVRLLLDIDTNTYSQESGLTMIDLLSPATIIIVNEFQEWRPGMLWTAAIVNFAAYGLCWAVLFGLNRHMADQWLGRNDGSVIRTPEFRQENGSPAEQLVVTDSGTVSRHS